MNGDIPGWLDPGGPDMGPDREWYLELADESGLAVAEAGG